MGLTITGGSGSGSKVCDGTPSDITLFTTPNDNAIYIVKFSLNLEEANQMASQMLQSGFNDSGGTSISFGGTGMGSPVGGTVKVGPNTPVLIQALVTGGQATVHYTYDWVAIASS
jgi:hypothetical protein